MNPERRSSIAVNVLIAITGLSVGFGSSQLTLTKDVHSNTANIMNLQHEVESERNRTDARIFELVGLVKEEVRQSTELITLIRVQNQQKP